MQKIRKVTILALVPVLVFAALAFAPSASAETTACVNVRAEMAWVKSEYTYNRDYYVDAYLSARNQILAVINLLESYGADVSDLRAYDVQMQSAYNDFETAAQNLFVRADEIINYLCAQPFVAKEGKLAEIIQSGRSDVKAIKDNWLEMYEIMNFKIKPEIYYLKDQLGI